MTPGSLNRESSDIILAIDLGKFKSVACIYQTANATHEFRTIRTTPAEVHDLIVAVQPRRVVIEIGSAAGWIKDLCEVLEASRVGGGVFADTHRPRKS